MNIKRKIADYMIKRIADPDYSFKVEENDVFLISYPKSGNTWMRFLLANILTDEKINLFNLGRIIPDIYRDTREDILNKVKPKIFKTHSYFRAKYSKNKIIYLVRDPRDVAVSYYFYYKKTKKVNIEFGSFFQKFMEGEIDDYGTWAENVGSWIGSKESSGNFLIVRYEDMLKDTLKEIKRVGEFLNLDVEEAKFKEAINRSSFNKLKREETINHNQVLYLKDTDKKISFFRSGKKKQWIDFLSEEQQVKLHQDFRIIMKKLGYN